MLNPTPPSSELLDRYLARRCSAAEEDVVRLWLASNPAWAVAADAVGQWNDTVPVATNARLAALKAMVDAERTALAVPSKPRAFTRGVPGGGSRARFLYSAAALVVAAGAVFGAARLFRPHAAPESRVYATQAGQRALVELADGSRLQLAPRTTVRVDVDPSTGARDVTLVGEAQFDVAPHANAPFVVRTGLVTTRVLGTTFAVRRYADDPVGQVVVTSGKVAVTANGATTTLAAGMARAFTDSLIALTDSLTDAAYTDWAHGRLVFTHARVSVVLARLKQWYGYDFRLADPAMGAEYVTTTFTLGETTQMMQRLKNLLSVRMEFDDSVVTLRPARESVTLERRTAPVRPVLSSSSEVGR